MHTMQVIKYIVPNLFYLKLKYVFFKFNVLKALPNFSLDLKFQLTVIFSF